MLPGGTDALYREALAAAHRRYVRIEVWSGDGILLDSFIPSDRVGETEGGLVIISGNVVATLDSRVARMLTIEVPMDMYPTSETDLLAPFGNEIRAFCGITLGDGSSKYTWQVFRGRIQEASMDSATGTCLISCSDRATDVGDHGFVNPQNSQPANTINQEWQRLIVEAVPNATFGPSDTIDRNVAPLTWEFDRASALDEMLRSLGALWYPLANGDFVLRRFPWTFLQPLVFTLTDGPGGTVISFNARRSRENIFNTVTVTGERLNGDPPVRALAQDVTPGSPTNVNGPFGVKSRVDRLQTPTTSGGAQHAAGSLLSAFISPVEEFTVMTVPDAAMELGDTGTLALGGRELIQVVTGFTLPVDLSGSMTVSTRSVVLGGVGV